MLQIYVLVISQQHKVSIANVVTIAVAGQVHKGFLLLGVPVILVVIVVVMHCDRLRKIDVGEIRSKSFVEEVICYKQKHLMI